jgi:hypothetical protein
LSVNPKATKHQNFIDRRNISCGPIPWCNEFPEVSSATETWSLSIWILILKSGCTLSMLGRCPVRSLNWSTIASLHFVRQTQSD